MQLALGCMPPGLRVAAKERLESKAEHAYCHTRPKGAWWQILGAFH